MEDTRPQPSPALPASASLPAGLAICPWARGLSLLAAAQPRNNVCTLSPTPSLAKEEAPVPLGVPLAPTALVLSHM